MVYVVSSGTTILTGLIFISFEMYLSVSDPRVTWLLSRKARKIQPEKGKKGSRIGSIKGFLDPGPKGKDM